MRCCEFACLIWYGRRRRRKEEKVRERADLSFRRVSPPLSLLRRSFDSYVGDGRFHLESIMIANPTVPAFRYDPYDKKFTREVYDHGEMRSVRAQAVGDARKSLVGVGAGGEEKDGEGRGAWAVVLGTLGRQGNLSVLNVSISSLAFLSFSLQFRKQVRRVFRLISFFPSLPLP